MATPQTIESLVSTIRDAADYAALTACASQIAHLYGYKYFTLIRTGNIDRVPAGLTLTNLPLEWIRYSVRNLNYLDSPILHHAARTIEPFQWSDIAFDKMTKQRQTSYLRKLEGVFSIRGGFTTPVHSPTRCPGLVSIMGEKQDRLAHADAAMAAYLSIALFNRVEQLAATTCNTATIDADTRATLKLMLRGRSLQFMSQKLGVSVSEVAKRVEAARVAAPSGSQIDLIARALYAPPARTQRRSSLRAAA